MRKRPPLARGVSLLAVVVAFALTPAAGADPSFYQGPAIFGISTGLDGTLLVADFGRGVVDGVTGELIAELPFVADVDPIAGTDELWAITQNPGDPTEGGFQFLYRIDGDGNAKRVADLYAFERRFNPHREAVDSNPFDVEDLGGGAALVADAGGNTLLKVDNRGRIQLVAVLPDELVSSANAAALLGEEFPPMMEAQPVATSVAVGPDGAYYVGELKGFPAPIGESRVWRIEPNPFPFAVNARDAQCGESPRCSVVLDGRTSIIDLVFGPDGRLYVTQIDDRSWLAVELAAFAGVPLTLGGSVHACNLATKACQQVVSGKPVLTAITFRGSSLWGATNSFFPGLDVTRLLP
jgi:hypothetical protein